MIRALLELVIAIVVLIAARAILSTVLRGLLTMGSSPATRPGQAPPQNPMPPGRELHKDPVCGTYVAESSPYRKQIGQNTFYYCSEECLDRHTAGVRR